MTTNEEKFQQVLDSIDSPAQFVKKLVANVDDITFEEFGYVDSLAIIVSEVVSLLAVIGLKYDLPPDELSIVVHLALRYTDVTKDQLINVTNQALLDDLHDSGYTDDLVQQIKEDFDV